MLVFATALYGNLLVDHIATIGAISRWHIGPAVVIDRHPIADLKDFRSATAKIKKGKSMLFLIQRGETTLFLAMKSR